MRTHGLSLQASLQLNPTHACMLLCTLMAGTGAVARVIDRGTRGINFLLSSMVFNVAPTLFEIVVVG